MEENKELFDSISKFQDILNEANEENEENYGFIMIPSNNGFDFYKIELERLRLYLQMEAMYLMNNVKEKNKKNLDRLYEKKAEFFNKTDDEILKIIEDDFGKDILIDIE